MAIEVKRIWFWQRRRYLRAGWSISTTPLGWRFRIWPSAHRLSDRTEPCEISRYPNGAPMFAPDGMMLDDKGNRSIFDDVDE